MNAKPVEPGDVLSGLEPSELVEVQRIAPFGSKMLVEGVGVDSRRVVRRPLTADEISRLLPLPRIRFLLADDTGAGKTIMTGLLLKELLFRGVIEKALIITEFKDTLKSLTKRLEQRGYTVTTIDGQMDVDARKPAQREFRARAKIMVATDTPGEGINLQFCRYLINWDIPWNPNRLEQRMGRIHCYGQQDDVLVYNLVAQNTREGSVLQKVLSKLDVMREQMGSDRVYDVIDEWLQGVPLLSLIEKAIDSEDAAEAEAETEDALRDASRDRAERLVALQKKNSLASRLDLHAARNLRDASDERRLQPLFIQRFFEKAWVACSGTIQRDDQFSLLAEASAQAGVWHLGPTPLALLDLARGKRKALAEKYDTPFVFDKQLASVASKTPVPDRTTLTANLPDLLTQAVVVPAPVAAMEEEPEPARGVPMRRNDEMEAIAMDVTMCGTSAAVAGRLWM